MEEGEIGSESRERGDLLPCSPSPHQPHQHNRPFAAKPSCDLLFIKLWAIA